MGYSTEFQGSLKIEPQLPVELAEQINEFCEERHGGNTSHPGYPGFWCDWRTTDNGSALAWNGNEKSYEMDKWLEVLIRDFLAPNGHVVNGQMKAQGEDMSDRWLLIAEDNRVRTEPLS